MKRKASELIFISRIIRDGSGTIPINEKLQEQLQNDKLVDDKYKINPLSLSNGTYIASGFNSYVVKLKTAINY